MCTNCDGYWLSAAKQVLQKNGIDVHGFGQAVYDLREKGRGKYRNIILVSPANCGKTFLLNPLNKIFRTFTNPASGSFAWIGAENAECIFLNDFRWSEKLIPWHDLLLMLQGQVVHLPAPKTHFARDISFTGDTLIFATSKHQLIYVKHGAVDVCETEMMSVRWRMFSLNCQIPQEQHAERHSMLPPLLCQTNTVQGGAVIFCYKH